ncbi:hypothetical protein LUZ60_010818 [Juncus effusus]|nr:hypothetical protein LUZ60_010818 [Juncus effusus]
MQLGSPILQLLILHLSFSLTSPSVSAAQPNVEPFALRISCGSRDDVRTPPTNTLWYRDYGYTGGRFSNATRPSFISPPLKTLRFFPLSSGPENCYYINNLPVGKYQIRVFFGLISDPNLDSEPIFDLSVEGTQFASLKQGWSSSAEQSFAEAILHIADNTASICFHGTGHGDPSILSIEVLQIDDSAYYLGKSWGNRVVLRPVKRLTCGAGKPAFDVDMNGTSWGGDRFWAAIKTFSADNDVAISTENIIAETSISPNFYPQALYQYAIVSTDREPQMSYQFDVDPNKNYSVWLHFAEIDMAVTKELERVFDVSINGDSAFKDVDVIRMAGERYTAIVLNTTVSVSGKSIKITFTPSVGHAIVSAIEVFEVINAEITTSPDEVEALRVIKTKLDLPVRFGWNGDPCVPQQHPWSGIDCHFDKPNNQWVIDGLGLDNQGLRGILPDEISKLQHLQSINLSENSIRGEIPISLGNIAGLQVLDLSFNELNGTIPESLGTLKNLQILNLNGNSLSGKVPANLGGRPLHRASFNFTGNDGLCGIPGLPTCGPRLSVGAKIGIAFGSLFAFLLLLVFATCWWKRRQNILRAQKLQAAREAPYAKARTHFRDIQMGKHHRQHEASKTAAETVPLS